MLRTIRKLIRTLKVSARQDSTNKERGNSRVLALHSRRGLELPSLVVIAIPRLQVTLNLVAFFVNSTDLSCAY